MWTRYDPVTAMILPLLFVYAATRAFWWVSHQPWVLRGPEWIDGFIKMGVWVLPAIVVAALLRRGSWRMALEDLGLTRPAWRGVALALAATLPMAALFAVAPLVIAPASLLGAVLLGPFAEEVLYRGFLFRQLHQRGRWPMPVAALASGVVFALAHHDDLYNYVMMSFVFGRLDTALGWIGPPMLAAVAGGCIFAWITWRWQSLWPAIVLHAAVNFWWDIAPAAVGSVVGSVAHGLALVIATVATWRMTTAPAVHRQSGNLDSSIAYRETGKRQSVIDW
jgi:membrane protease YdiL (CAAX protease family)